MPLTEPSDARAVDPALLGTAAVEEVLYEAEEPVIYTTRDASGQLLLAYVADQTPDATWLVLAACAPRVIEDLKRGRLAVRDALTASWMWLARRAPDGTLSKAWAITPEHLPPEHLPAAGTPLLPEHEPVISTRAIGDAISPGTTPASVVAYVADSTRKAVKTLLDFILERPAEGRPPEELRALYDLPVQRFAFNSFEVAFGVPPGFFDSPELSLAASLLSRGLSWAAEDSERRLEVKSEEERAVLLRAVLQLTPPPGGPITAIEVSGSWISHGAARLTRAARRRVHGEIRRLRTERVVRRSGRIGEVDRDNCTLILRDADGKAVYRGMFEESLLDDIVDFFAENRRVVVVGVERGGRLHITAVGAMEQDVSGEGHW